MSCHEHGTRRRKGKKTRRVVRQCKRVSDRATTNTAQQTGQGKGKGEKKRKKEERLRCARRGSFYDSPPEGIPLSLSAHRQSTAVSPNPQSTLVNTPSVFCCCYCSSLPLIPRGPPLPPPPGTFSCTLISPPPLPVRGCQAWTSPQPPSAPLEKV